MLHALIKRCFNHINGDVNVIKSVLSFHRFSNSIIVPNATTYIYLALKDPT